MDEAEKKLHHANRQLLLAYLKQEKEEQRFLQKERKPQGREEEAKQQKNQRQKSPLLNPQGEVQEAAKSRQQKKAQCANLQQNLQAENQHLSQVAVGVHQQTKVRGKNQHQNRDVKVNT